MSALVKVIAITSLMVTQISACTVAQENHIADSLIAGGTKVIRVNDHETTIIRDYENCILNGSAVHVSTTTSYSRDVGYGLKDMIKAGRDYGYAGGNGNFYLNIGTY